MPSLFFIPSFLYTCYLSIYLAPTLLKFLAFSTYSLVLLFL